MMRDEAGLHRTVAQVTAPGRAGKPDDVDPAIASRPSGGDRRVNTRRIEVSSGTNIRRGRSGRDDAEHEAGLPPAAVVRATSPGLPPRDAAGASPGRRDRGAGPPC